MTQIASGTRTKDEAKEDELQPKAGKAAKTGHTSTAKPGLTKPKEEADEAVPATAMLGTSSTAVLATPSKAGSQGPRSVKAEEPQTKVRRTARR